MFEALNFPAVYSLLSGANMGRYAGFCHFIRGALSE